MMPRNEPGLDMVARAPMARNLLEIVEIFDPGRRVGPSRVNEF